MAVVRHTPQRAIVVAATLLASTFVLLYATRQPNPHDTPTSADIAQIAAGSALLVLFASALASLCRRRYLNRNALQAQLIFRLAARRLAPPAVAATLTVFHTNSVGLAASVFFAMLLASMAVGGTRYPLHLSDLARFIFDLLMPALGVSLALGAGVAWGFPLNPGEMIVPLLGAWLVTFIGGWLEEAFNTERPVRLAVIADADLARTFTDEMETAGVRDCRMVGWIARASQPPADRAQHLRAENTLGIRRLGSIDRVRETVLESEIDLLVIPPRDAGDTLFEETVGACVDLPVRVVPASQLYEEMHGRVPIMTIDETWFAYIMHPNFTSSPGWSKRLTDIAVSAVLLVVLAPILMLVAVAIKFGDRGPALYRQRRVGAHGREFDVLKFRTMREGAESDGVALWARPEDERVTRVGRLLRRSHLDEVPQLINVLGGGMSLVGPRPERPEFVAELKRKIPYYSRRMLVKPGITGWAQVRAGYADSETGTAFKLCHDLYYIKHRSFLFDLLTMIETVRTFVMDEQHGQLKFSASFVLRDSEAS